MICGYLTNAFDVREREGWVQCDDSLIALGYGSGWASWKGCNIAELEALVEGCGQLSGSQALVEAREVLPPHERPSSSSQSPICLKFMRLLSTGAFCCASA